MKSFIVVHSYHHMNTLKVANELASVLGCHVERPSPLLHDLIKDLDLIGFGAGIDSGKHYQPLLDFANELERVHQKKAFIFSTSAVQSPEKTRKDHLALRSILINKGYDILGEFSCKGFNTNSFLKFFGGMNKNRPSAEDLTHARIFAKQLIKNKEIN